MRALFKLPIILGLLLCGLSFSGQAQEWTDQEIQEVYLQALTDIGIDGWIDSDGDVQFEHNGHSYYIGVHESDAGFIQIVLFNIWPIESNSEAVQVAFACDAVNRELKVAKAYTTNDNVWIAAEMFMSGPREIRDVLERCINTIEDAVDTFVENM